MKNEQYSIMFESVDVLRSIVDNNPKQCCKGEFLVLVFDSTIKNKIINTWVVSNDSFQYDLSSNNGCFRHELSIIGDNTVLIAYIFNHKGECERLELEAFDITHEAPTADNPKAKFSETNNVYYLLVKGVNRNRMQQKPVNENGEIAIALDYHESAKHIFKNISRFDSKIINLIAEDNYQNELKRDLRRELSNDPKYRSKYFDNNAAVTLEIIEIDRRIKEIKDEFYFITNQNAISVHDFRLEYVPEGECIAISSDLEGGETIIRQDQLIKVQFE